MYLVCALESIKILAITHLCFVVVAVNAPELASIIIHFVSTRVCLRRKRTENPEITDKEILGISENDFHFS